MSPTELSVSPETCEATADVLWSCQFDKLGGGTAFGRHGRIGSCPTSRLYWASLNLRA